VLILESGRKIGPDHPCFIVGEAGSNWRLGTPERDLAMGFALIDVAADAGCDAVKFQTYRPETVYVSDAGESDYLAEVGIKASINEIFEDLAMPYEMLGRLAEHARQRGILFMSTPFSIADADAVDPFVEIHKIASFEISHTQLQVHLAEKGKPIVFSTGASQLEDIDWAVKNLRNAGADQLAIMQCTAKYPAPLESINLRVLPELAACFGVPIGLSDHSREPAVAPAAAVALGASIVEKHFTLHNRLPGADHPFALEPHELKAMVHAIRQTERALGRAQKGIGEVERELHAFARRGLQAIRTIAVGEPIALDVNVAVLRPGKHSLGAHPRHFPQLLGKRAKRRIPAGGGVTLADV
jgi:N-acetylneuraminate synthase